MAQISWSVEVDMTLAVRLCDIDGLQWRDMSRVRGGNFLSASSSLDDKVSVGNSSTKVTEIFDDCSSLSK